MATPSFCDAVLNVLGRETYPADCGTVNCPQRCVFPDAAGNCPPSAVVIAQKTDLLRRSSGRAREVVLTQLADAGSELWAQYRVNAASVTWEDITERCRLPSGAKRSRDDLASLGYDFRGRPYFFSRPSITSSAGFAGGSAGFAGDSADSADSAHPWIDKLENYPVDSEGTTVAAAIDPFVPLVADRLLPPVLAFVVAAFFVLVIVIVLAVAMRRLSQPDREIIVRPAAAPLI